jgi:hypothetical protein
MTQHLTPREVEEVIIQEWSPSPSLLRDLTFDLRTGRGAWSSLRSSFHDTRLLDEEHFIFSPPVDRLRRSLEGQIADLKRTVTRLSKEILDLRKEVNELKESQKLTFPHRVLRRSAWAEHQASQLLFEEFYKEAAPDNRLLTSFVAHYAPARRAEIAKHRDAEKRFQEGQTYFEANKASLLSQFEDKYIAILENRVIDSDDEYSPLAERVFEKYGPESIYIPRVQKAKRRAYIRPGVRRA